jgi:hypothetical protein
MTSTAPVAPAQAADRRQRQQRRRGARIELATENTLVTSDEEFASAERSDDLLARVLGKSLDRRRCGSA